MIEEAVLAKVLGAALRTGGDFAEVFAEDKRSSSARFDDGRIEELGAGHGAEVPRAGVREAVEGASELLL